MNAVSSGGRPTQGFALAAGLCGAVAFYFLIAAQGWRIAALFIVGLGLGVTLYHGALGFAGDYRRFFVSRDASGLIGQIWMLAFAMLLFAPMLATGEVLGNPVSGAVAPVGVSMFLGALLFGIGMQLGGGCGSGALFGAGGGDLRLIVTLAFFCLGGFWGSLDLERWRALPEVPGISLGRLMGFGPAIVLQLAVLGCTYLALRRVHGAKPLSLWPRNGLSLRGLLHGPWPLLPAAAALAALSGVTLALAGHPWAITWGLTLWGAKTATLVGWDPATSGFWSDGFPRQALTAPVLNDITSIMDIGILLGAFMAAALAGRLAPNPRIPPRPLAAAVIGGLLLGYGARLAYGCNIGAFFSGVASTSLHGWIWIVAALPGNWIGVKLRPYFHLS